MSAPVTSSFEQFNLPPQLLKALTDLKFHQPTPIQVKAIPVAMTGKDVMGMAQTGTGKTAAFGIPMVSRLLANQRENALVLAPTRELATQIFDFLQDLTRQTPHISCAILIGGLSMRQQFKQLGRRPRIIIATPGRMMDHLGRQNNLLNFTAMLVLDEADRMLDMGFAPQLEKIRKYLPRERQTMLFSATYPKNIRQLASEYLRNPQEISVGETSRPVQKIKQDILETTVKEKNNVLMDELNKRQGSVLIFARTKNRTDRLTKFLHEFGFKVAKIHGDCSQAQRQNSIDMFKGGKIRILVATDIASRGIDVPDIGHVINYDLPQAPEDYVHRIGRTGRNGKEGHALCLLTPEDRNQWKYIARGAGLASGMTDQAHRKPKHHGRGHQVGGSDRRGPPRRDERPRHHESRAPRATENREERFERYAREDRPQRSERSERPEHPRHGGRPKGMSNAARPEAKNGNRPPQRAKPARQGGRPSRPHHSRSFSRNESSPRW